MTPAWEDAGVGELEMVEADTRPPELPPRDPGRIAGDQAERAGDEAPGNLDDKHYDRQRQAEYQNYQQQPQVAAERQSSRQFATAKDVTDGREQTEMPCVFGAVYQFHHLVKFSHPFWDTD